MDTLAIVVSYNDKDNTLKAVESLLGQARIVVWDNGSDDGTAELLESTFGNTIITHRSPANILWTPALNQAIALYRQDEKYVLFSNNDIVYQPDCVKVLEKVCKADPKVGIVAPAGSGLGGPQDFATHYGATASNYGFGQGMTPALLRYISRLPTKRTNYVVGAAMLVPFTAWDKLGPLDDSMPLGADDHDYCIRAKQAGYKIMVAYSAYVSHKSHSSFSKARDTWNEWGSKSWDAFNEKWAGYFHDQEEATKVHWEALYTEGWDIGTGWLTAEERASVYELRRRLASVEEMPPV